MAEDRQQEIDEIMNEIQSLQAGMASVTEPEAPVAAAKPTENAAPAAKLAAVASPQPVASTPAPAPAPSSLSDFHASGSDTSMEDALVDVKDDSEGLTVGGELVDAPRADSQVTPSHEAHSPEEAHSPGIEEEFNSMNDSGSDVSEDGSLTMTLKGRMSLRLKYECEGQEVSVGFEDGCLKVKLSDGTEFKVPVARNAPVRTLRAA